MLSLLLPVACPVCGAAGESPCRSCRRALRAAPLMGAPPELDALVVLCAYEGTGRELVARLKYHRLGRSALPWLAASLAVRCAAAGLEADVVTWVPTSRRRRWARGFDQSELLARAVARHLHLPCRRLLVRAAGPPQTGRSAAERHAGPRLRARHSPFPAVLVIDDVLTTGASMTAAAAALRAAGALTVSGAALARTPLKVGATCSDS